ncbi:MAG: hypothetical protein O2975_09205 [Proteobacteria bacterium]|nr:hypothetical protein [Pseudomonadota bacterium]
MLALAFVLLQPICNSFVAHAGAAVAGMQPDAPAGHEAPCCDAIGSDSLVKKADSVPSSWGDRTIEVASVDAPPVFIGGRGAALIGTAHGAGPPRQLTFYARSSRILR